MSEQTQLSVALTLESPIRVFLAQSPCGLVLIHLIWNSSRNDGVSAQYMPDVTDT